MQNNLGNTAFLDIVLNLALAMTVLFIIAVMMISTPQKPAKHEIESKDDYLITLDWNNESTYDIDLYIRNPNGEIIYFRHKDSAWGTLERDDYGMKNDIMIVDGETVVYKVNREVIHLRNLLPGEYTVNVNVFSRGTATPAEDAIPQNFIIEFTQFKPLYNVLFKKNYDIQMKVKDEITMFNFVYIPGQAITIDTKTQNPYVLDVLGGTVGSVP